MKARVAFVVLIALVVAGCGGRPGSKVPAPPAQKAQAPAQQTPSGAPAPPPDQVPSTGGETEAPQTSQPTGSPQPQQSTESQSAESPESPAQGPESQPSTSPPAAPESTPAPPQSEANQTQPATSAPSPAASPAGPVNLLAWDQGAILRMWPADTDPDTSVAGRFCDREGSSCYDWQSKKGSSGPYTFVFELPAEATIDRLGFRAGGDADTRAQTVHAAVSTQGMDRGFTDVGTFTLQDAEENNVQEFSLRPARAARWIRMTIEPRPNGQTGLGGVLAYGRESTGTKPATLAGIWLFDNSGWLSFKDDPLFGPSGRLPAAIGFHEYLKQACGNERGCNKTGVLQVVQNGDHFSGAACEGDDFWMGNSLFLHGRISGRSVRWKSYDGQDVFGAVNAEGTLFVGKFGSLPFLAMKVSDGIPCATPPPVGSGKKVLAVVDASNKDGTGKEYPFGYPDAFPGYRFVPVLAPLLQASDLVGAESVVFDEICYAGNLLDEWQQGLILDFVRSGHKLIIGDADSCGNQANYSLLPYPFTTSNPGAQGARGDRLILVEPNSLGTDNRRDSAHFTDLPAFVASDQQQIGDANTVTSQDAHWCGHLFGTNALNVNGFMHMYARYGSGLIIYHGFDTDDALVIPTHQRLIQLELAQDPSATLPCTQSVAARFLVAPSQDVPFVPGRAQSLTVRLEVLANQGYAGTVSLTATPPDSQPWSPRLSATQVTLKGGTAPTDLTIDVPATATEKSYKWTVAGSDAAGHSASAVITLVARTPEAPPKNVQVTEEACKIRITMASGILFDFDKDNLKPGAEAVLAETKASIIDKHPGARLVIEGHTDDRGTQDYNLKLSGRRAQSVAGWLSRQGIPASRLETKGYGKLKPRYPNTTDENRARNRRVEIIVVTCPGP